MATPNTVNASTIDLAKNPGAVTSAAQSQWFRRPADHKFASLDALEKAVQSRRNRSFEVKTDVTKFRWRVRQQSAGGNDIVMIGRPEIKRPELVLQPTHYSFGQACQLVGVPAGYVRDHLHTRPDLTVALLNHGFEKRASESMKIMGVQPAGNQGPLDRLQAVTSETYGRIWDADVVAAAKRIVEAHPAFHAPLDWGKEKRALFASDRDVFMFFIDGGSIVEGGGERDALNRGWFMWNSEVGSRTFGIATFLFRQCCGNFGIWGAQDVRVLKIRHTSGGPERFITEAIPALNEYVRMSAKPIEEAVKKAKALELPAAEDEFTEFFLKRKFTRAEIRRAVEHADAEEGQHHTLWDMYNGFTAAARMLAFADAKVDLEKRAGALMESVVAA